MTNQEYFDKSVKHVLTQGKPSYVQMTNTRKSCRYRGPNGLKCGIGGMIPDKAYKPDWDLNNRIVTFDDIFEASGGDRSIPLQLNLALSLQDAHDRAAYDDKGDEAFIAAYKANIAKVARRFNLT